MKLWLLLLPGGTLILLAIWILKRRFDRDHVSEAWLTDQDRRLGGAGLDGVSWTWPVNKAVNENARFNRWQLRKRA